MVLPPGSFPYQVVGSETGHSLQILWRSAICCCHRGGAMQWPSLATWHWWWMNSCTGLYLSCGCYYCRSFHRPVNCNLRDPGQCILTDGKLLTSDVICSMLVSGCERGIVCAKAWKDRVSAKFSCWSSISANSTDALINYIHISMNETAVNRCCHVYQISGPHCQSMVLWPTFFVRNYVKILLVPFSGSYLWVSTGMRTKM